MKNIFSVMILAFQVLVFGIISLVFISRAPVLVVTDESFASLYGMERVKLQQFYASLSLFRPVKNVMFADGISEDVLIITLREKSENPYCVIFPSSFSSAAEYYHSEYPDNLLVLFRGKIPEDSLPLPDETLFLYNTDAELDLYRAGLFAGIINFKEKYVFRLNQIFDSSDAVEKKIIGLTIDDSITDSMRNIFSRGVDETTDEAEILFVSVSSDLPGKDFLSCVVFAGFCDNFFERHPDITVILFSWLDPVFTSDDVAVIFDDSPWAQALPAVKMAEKRQKTGSIPSKILIFSDRIADNAVFRRISEDVKKTLN